MVAWNKIARTSPAVTHLFFADDSLFFCQAKREQFQTNIRILQKYEAVSGQQINFTKSSVRFGYKVNAVVREEMKQILGITTNGGMRTYLRIPESLGGPNSQVFGFIH